MRRLLVWALIATSIIFVLVGIAFITYSPSSPDNSQTQSGSTAANTVSQQSNGSQTGDIAPSPPSAQQPPPSPTGFIVVEFSSTYVRLSWNPSVEADKYVVYRGSTPSLSQAKVLTTTTNTNFDDEGVLPLTTYYYWVTASNIAGAGQPGQGIEITTYQHWRDIEGEYQDSIVKIKTYTSALGVLGNFVDGTGWFAPGGYIVTNWHVVRNWNWVIDVYLNNDGGTQYTGQKYHATLVASDQAHDVAILKLENGWSGQPLSIGGPVSINDPIAALGHPGGEQIALTTGVVQMTGINEQVNGIGTLPNMVGTDIGVVGGSSGSPVFNHWGQVVGVVESADPNNGNISYFVPVQYLGQWGITGTTIEGPQTLK